jgi:Rod binding domain-containing protein
MMNIDQNTVSQNSAVGQTEKLDPAQKARLQKAAREFESIFVGYMLKSMRNTIDKADNSTEGFGSDILESMGDIELAKHISKNSNLGLAEMLYRKMTGESLPIPSFRPAPDATQVMSAYPGMNSQANKASKHDSLEERLEHYSPFIAEAAAQQGLSENLIKAVIASESAGRANALSSKDAKGLMQLIDSTASDMGVKNVWDPRENILGGAKYLKQLLEKFDGDEKLAVASYNAGPGNVVKHGGIPPFKETKEYVTRVMNFLQLFEQQENTNE